jgi:hypothetical protein
MQRNGHLRRTIAVTSLAAAAAVGMVAAPTVAAGASTPPAPPVGGPPQGPQGPQGPATAPGTGPSASGSVLEQRLLHQLQLRSTQLANLSKEVSAATALTPGDQGALEQKLATTTTSINGLLQAVPTDTRAQLRVAARTMVVQNRVFAVLTPQVYEVIASDTVAGQAAALASEEAALQAQVTADQGQVGYRNAVAYDGAFVRSVSAAQAGTARVSATLLAQVPQDYPRDRGVFVRSNRQILGAAEALARASYDKTLIALATNGYTGS